MGQPKRVPNKFMLFSSELQYQPNERSQAKQRRAAALWRAMTDTEKLPYHIRFVKMTAAFKAAYRREHNEEYKYSPHRRTSRERRRVVAKSAVPMVWLPSLVVVDPGTAGHEWPSLDYPASRADNESVQDNLDTPS